jgi:hypothetical protein
MINMITKLLHSKYIVDERSITEFDECIDVMERSGITSNTEAFNVMYMWRGMMSEIRSNPCATELNDIIRLEQINKVEGEIIKDLNAQIVLLKQINDKIIPITTLSENARVLDLLDEKCESGAEMWETPIPETLNCVREWIKELRNDDKIIDETGDDIVLGSL